MKSEKSATGILKRSDYGDSIFYKVVCTCDNPDHDIDFEVESDELGIKVNTYVTVKSDYWTETFPKRYDIKSDWLQSIDWHWKEYVNGFISRVKMTWKIWVHGYVKCESTIIMTEQQALNYSETIKTAIDDLKKRKYK